MNKKIFNSTIILDNFSKILETEKFNNIDLITTFENKIKKYNNDEKNYYIAFDNDTNAYNTIIKILTNKNKNKIIIPSICSRDFLFSIINSNIEPIFCEINNYGNIDENYLNELLLNDNINKNEIAAIIIFHNNGIPSNIDEINKIANQYNIPIIEDASESFGSEYNNKKIGNSNNIVIFTFDENNILYSGGISIIVTSNFNLADKLYAYRNFGKSNKNNIIGSTYLENNNYSIVGANYLPNIFNIIIGLNNLNFIDAEINIKKELYNFYLQEIKKINLLDYYIITNEIPEYCTKYNYNSFRLIIGKQHSRDLLAKFLNHNNITYYIKDVAYYKLPILNFKNIYFKKADIFDKQSIIFPINSNINSIFQKKVINKIKEYFIYEKNI